MDEIAENECFLKNLIKAKFLLSMLKEIISSPSKDENYFQFISPIDR